LLAALLSGVKEEEVAPDINVPPELEFVAIFIPLISNPRTRS
jgi:hypothetical protein